MLAEWLKKHSVQWIEYCVADTAGIFRGKLVKATPSFSVQKLPLDIFAQTIDGQFVAARQNSNHDSGFVNAQDADFSMVADVGTVSIMPWAKEPTASLICDAYDLNGNAIAVSARQILQRVLTWYEQQGWQAVVAAELEFVLFKRPNEAMSAPSIASGRNSANFVAKQCYSLEALDGFDDFFADLWRYCEIQHIACDTLVKEVSPAQFEVNLKHGDALTQADQACRFKRTVREVARRHNLIASFMAKPLAQRAGNSMHIHQSVVEKKTQKNLFSDPLGQPNDLFRAYIGGLKRYLPEATALLLPFVNSYRRLAPGLCAPLNVEWSMDNRTVGLRVPQSKSGDYNADMRVENRLPGADCNPYLAIAINLALGYQGTVEHLSAGEPFSGNAYHLPSSLPLSQESALVALNNSKRLKTLLGQDFIGLYQNIKTKELAVFNQVITDWEIQHLLGII